MRTVSSLEWPSSSATMTRSVPPRMRVVALLISPGSGVLPGRSAFSVSRHVRHGEARGERRGAGEARRAKNPISDHTLLRWCRRCSRSRAARADGQVQPRAPGPLRRRAVERFQVARDGRCRGHGVGPDTADGAGRAMSAAGGIPAAPWAWHSRRWSDIMPGRRFLSHPSAVVVGAARLMLQGANSHRGTAFRPGRAVGSCSDEPGRPDRRNLGCPAPGVIGWWL